MSRVAAGSKRSGSASEVTVVTDTVSGSCGAAVNCGIGRASTAPYGSTGGRVRPIPPTWIEATTRAASQSPSSYSGEAHCGSSSRASKTSGICGEIVVNGREGVHAVASRYRQLSSVAIHSWPTRSSATSDPPPSVNVVGVGSHHAVRPP
nr:hypothetical protein [Catenulispora pinistramenti]